ILPISASMVWPTFSSRLIRLISVAMNASPAGSTIPTLCADGHSAACARPRRSPFPAAASAARMSTEPVSSKADSRMALVIVVTAGIEASKHKRLQLQRLHRDRAYRPDVRAVLPDRPVGREFAGAGAIQDRHARPAFVVAVRIVVLPLTVGV